MTCNNVLDEIIKIFRTIQAFEENLVTNLMFLSSCSQLVPNLFDMQCKAVLTSYWQIWNKL